MLSHKQVMPYYQPPSTFRQAVHAHPQHLPDHASLFCIAQMRLQQRQDFQLLPPHVFAQSASHSISGSRQLMRQLRCFCSTTPGQSPGTRQQQLHAAESGPGASQDKRLDR